MQPLQRPKLERCQGEIEPGSASCRQKTPWMTKRLDMTSSLLIMQSGKPEPQSAPRTRCMKGRHSTTSRTPQPWRAAWKTAPGQRRIGTARVVFSALHGECGSQIPDDIYSCPYSVLLNIGVDLHVLQGCSNPCPLQYWVRTTEILGRPADANGTNGTNGFWYWLRGYRLITKTPEKGVQVTHIKPTVSSVFLLYSSQTPKPLFHSLRPPLLTGHASEPSSANRYSATVTEIPPPNLPPPTSSARIICAVSRNQSNQPTPSPAPVHNTLPSSILPELFHINSCASQSAIRVELRPSPANELPYENLPLAVVALQRQSQLTASYRIVRINFPHWTLTFNAPSFSSSGARSRSQPHPRAQDGSPPRPSPGSLGSWDRPSPHPSDSIDCKKRRDREKGSISLFRCHRFVLTTQPSDRRVKLDLKHHRSTLLSISNPFGDF
ncbi:hypothetical protein SODALDRAFT_362900 [Sodiomyces alkalinus F11]|uniref:Uncharacterized protein n=1 Tax=Sodiomyces alkalinus (strain CBS 110278 / VKM F-3762 / F11) TaxID=1314773 RepID=A0A3N2PNH0_SODAK|nr:hypothetical protein SODALDRAFT_362900 [Sodiomyces alkalinus F11]ROT36039.1 hypothetical protein SODALDRAFT_362900 [Sodiomyces alkalinus F11]